MSPYYLALDFAAGDPSRDHLSIPVAQIVAAQGRSEDGERVRVSPTCMGATELTAAIAHLRKELDEIEREGKRRFAAHQPKRQRD